MGSHPIFLKPAILFILLCQSHELSQNIWTIFAVIVSPKNMAPLFLSTHTLHAQQRYLVNAEDFHAVQLDLQNFCSTVVAINIYTQVEPCLFHTQHTVQKAYKHLLVKK
jgi:hypothetical protein